MSAVTVPTAVPVEDFLADVTPQVRRDDAHVLLTMMAEVSGERPVMWGPSIIGFGQYSYRYDSGREGIMFHVGFSPRKANLSLYGLTSVPDADDWFARLGKVKRSRACTYITRLSDLDLQVLKDFTVAAWRTSLERHQG